MQKIEQLVEEKLIQVTGEIEISERAAHRIAEGYRWVFSNELRQKVTAFEPGQWCQFQSKKKLVGTGYLNPHSLIAGRIIAAKEINGMEDYLATLIKNAFELRQPLVLDGAARLIFSEADSLPGLIVDYFNGAAVLQSGTAGIDGILPFLEKAIPEIFKSVFKKPLQGFVLRGDSSIRSLEGISTFSRVAFNETPDLQKHPFQEDGLIYLANVLDGQKTGFFLDQRENRQSFGKVVKENGIGEILDLYSSSGAWGLRGLVNGAAHVTFVDESFDAIGLVGECLKLNNLPPEKSLCVDEDVFDYLPKNTQSYGAVVCDPPAFMKSKKAFYPGLKAYEKLNRLAWQRVKKGGWLFTSSCSHHLSEADFISVLRKAVAKEGGIAHLVYRGYQAKDHPVLLSMPETQYLKCVGLRKIK